MSEPNETVDPLYIIVAAMNAEYNMDECCDYVKINRMIEEAAELVSQRLGGLSQLDKLADHYTPDAIWALMDTIIPLKDARTK